MQLFSKALQMLTPSKQRRFIDVACIFISTYREMVMGTSHCVSQQFLFFQFFSCIKEIVFQRIHWKDFFFFFLVKTQQKKLLLSSLFLSLSHTHTLIKMLKEQSFIPHTLALYLTFGNDLNSTKEFYIMSPCRLWFARACVCVYVYT